tara:strand:+ start:127225 stop:128607 length:1383 start_codon:yes stop_codon:yes gene_type:complete
LACSTSSNAIGGEAADVAEQRDWHRLSNLIDQHADLDEPQADGMTALHWSAFYENESAVKRLIQADCQIDTRTRYSITPLSIACTSGNDAIVSLLLGAGANPNAVMPGGESMLMIASRTGKIKPVLLLLGAGADVNATDKRNQTALMWAAHDGHADVVEALIKVGANIDHTLKSGFCALMFAARQGQIDVVETLIAAGADVNDMMKPASTQGRAPRRGMSALMLAVESGHFELALRLVDAGADPNDQRSRFAPLHALSWVRKANRGDNPAGDPEPQGSGNVTSLQFVTELVKAGADVNLALKNGNSSRTALNPVGATPLLFAAKTADVPLIKLLVELGADPMIPNEVGTTPLMAAAGVGIKSVDEEAGTEAEVLEAVTYFLERGGQINDVNENHETTIHGACYRSFPAVAQLLIDRGADPDVWNTKNKYGWTPLMIAHGKRAGSVKPSPEMIRVLENALQ